MTGPAYPAAQAVAGKVHDHYARHLLTARQHGQQPLPPPVEPAILEAVIDTAFWAGLRREEGHGTRTSLALLPAGLAERPILFERPLPLSPGVLARLAAAVEGPGIHLGVWPAADQLFLWGITRSIPVLCLVVEVVAPGLLVIKYRRIDDGGKFANIAVLEGDQIKFVNEQASTLPDCPPLVTTLLGFESPASWAGSVNVLVQIAVSMRAHGRGGSLLVVSAATGQWRESIVHPIPYAVSPPFSGLADLMRVDPAERHQRAWQDALNHAVDTLAGLTAVDGATIITERFEVLAFGATIGRRDGWPQVERVIVTEPIEGVLPATVHPAHLGGTRHLSAAQFVQDQRDAAALVASQDGRFTLFAWSPSEGMVHAHRVESLLL
jgi:hypothetical protein